MTDLRTFLGEGSGPGQDVDIYHGGVHIADGSWIDVSPYLIGMKGKTRIIVKEFSFTIEVHKGSQGQPRGTCTVVWTFNGTTTTDDKATFDVDRYWINVHTAAAPIRGRYAIWRNGKATDATTPPFRVAARFDPKKHGQMPMTLAELGYNPELTGPPAEDGGA